MIADIVYSRSVRSCHGEQPWTVHILWLQTRGGPPSTEQRCKHASCRYTVNRNQTQNTSVTIGLYQHQTLCLCRYAVYSPEGSSVKVNAKLLEESHPGSCLLRWYPPWWVIWHSLSYFTNELEIYAFYYPWVYMLNRLMNCYLRIVLVVHACLCNLFFSQ